MRRYNSDGIFSCFYKHGYDDWAYAYYGFTIALIELWRVIHDNNDVFAGNSAERVYSFSAGGAGIHIGGQDVWLV